MSAPLRPVTITLSPTEILTTSTVFSLFSNIMKEIEFDAPDQLKADMGNIILKMMQEVERQYAATQN